MKEKQQVTWLNKQITINKHPPCHTASGTELHSRAAPIRALCFGHVTALSLCRALFVTGEVSKRKRPKKKREKKKQRSRERMRGTEMERYRGGLRRWWEGRALVTSWEMGRDEGGDWGRKQVQWREEGRERNEAVRMWQRHQRGRERENRDGQSEAGRWMGCL